MTRYIMNIILSVKKLSYFVLDLNSNTPRRYILYYLVELYMKLHK